MKLAAQVVTFVLLISVCVSVPIKTFITQEGIVVLNTVDPLFFLLESTAEMYCKDLNLSCIKPNGHRDKKILDYKSAEGSTAKIISWIVSKLKKSEKNKSVPSKFFNNVKLTPKDEFSVNLKDMNLLEEVGLQFYLQGLLNILKGAIIGFKSYTTNYTKFRPYDFNLVSSDTYFENNTSDSVQWDLSPNYLLRIPNEEMKSLRMSFFESTIDSHKNLYFNKIEDLLPEEAELIQKLNYSKNEATDKMEKLIKFVYIRDQPTVAKENQANLKSNVQTDTPPVRNFKKNKNPVKKFL